MDAPDTCLECGAALPANAAFCPGCGRPVEGGTGTTRRAELPPHETGPVPVARVVSERRLFGVAPPLLLLALALAGFAAAIALFVSGRWAVGLIVVGASVLLATLFLETARRAPGGEAARRARAAVDGARARAGTAVEAVAIRGRAGRETALLRLELRRLRARRRELLTAFGDAVYRGAPAEELRGRLEELDVRARDLDAHLQALAVETRERIRDARLAVQETEMVTVPEPYPPPDEGSPAAPAIVPEPGPPPDEGSPPRPDPAPAPFPEEPEPGRADD